MLAYLSPEFPMVVAFPAFDPFACLERSYIEEYLGQKGHTRASLGRLSHFERRRLMVEASIYASGRLAEA
jgi:hypothetical protein